MSTNGATRNLPRFCYSCHLLLRRRRQYEDENEGRSIQIAGTSRSRAELDVGTANISKEFPPACRQKVCVGCDFNSKDWKEDKWTRREVVNAPVWTSLENVHFRYRCFVLDGGNFTRKKLPWRHALLWVAGGVKDSRSDYVVDLRTYFCYEVTKYKWLSQMWIALHDSIDTKTIEGFVV